MCAVQLSLSYTYNLEDAVADRFPVNAECVVGWLRGLYLTEYLLKGLTENTNKTMATGVPRRQRSGRGLIRTTG